MEGAFRPPDFLMSKKPRLVRVNWSEKKLNLIFKQNWARTNYLQYLPSVDLSRIFWNLKKNVYKVCIRWSCKLKAWLFLRILKILQHLSLWSEISVLFCTCIQDVTTLQHHVHSGLITITVPTPSGSGSCIKIARNPVVTAVMDQLQLANKQ